MRLIYLSRSTVHSCITKEKAKYPLTTDDPELEKFCKGILVSLLPKGSAMKLVEYKNAFHQGLAFGTALMVKAEIEKSACP